MLAGEEHPDAGAVTLRRGARVAYLHQVVDGDERTVRQVLAAARPEAAALEEELARVEAQLADPALVADLDRMGRVLERQAALIERLGADTAGGGFVQEVTLFSPGPSIYGGTDQVQRNIIGERVLGLPKEPGPAKDTPYKELLVNG